jgi:hypothetical protein
VNNQRTANSFFAQWRLKCFYDSLFQGSNLVLPMNICAKNPLFFQTPKSWWSLSMTSKRDEEQGI